MQKLVVLSGAGISAESGIKTFRDSDGLWENYSIEEVATFEAWQRNPKLVLKFYNERRRQLQQVTPNKAHYLVAELEQHYDVEIITQNVDDLHERAGSAKVLHLHGELLKVRSTKNEQLIYKWHQDLHLGDVAEDGSRLRPHIVWFGEQVPLIEAAAAICSKADIFVVIGTSLVVYPAAGLIHYTDFAVPKYVIDPNQPNINSIQNIEYITEKASVGMQILFDRLTANKQ